jgi:phage-related protein
LSKNPITTASNGWTLSPCVIQYRVRYTTRVRRTQAPAAAFFRSLRGAKPVRDWLKGLSDADRRIRGYDIGMAEFGWPVGMPLCRSLGDSLWEVRSNLPGNRIARTMFCVADSRMVLLHGFVKKTQKTPKQDLDLVRARQKELQS